MTAPHVAQTKLPKWPFWVVLCRPLPRSLLIKADVIDGQVERKRVVKKGVQFRICATFPLDHLLPARNSRAMLDQGLPIVCVQTKLNQSCRSPYAPQGVAYLVSNIEETDASRLHNFLVAAVKRAHSLLQTSRAMAVGCAGRPR